MTTELYQFDCFKCNGKKLNCKHCLDVKKKRFPFEFIDNKLIELNKQKDEIILIVGGGIGGLAIGIVLLQFGFKVKLIEKDKEFNERKQGYGLTMQQGNSALRELGILLPKETISTSHYVFDENGRILGYFGSTFSKYFYEIINGKEIEINNPNLPSGKFEGKGRFNIHIPRQKLRELLFFRLLELGKVTKKLDFCWNTQLKEIKQSNENVKCKLFSEGKVENLQFDYVVAADGIYSTIRKRLFPEHKLEFLFCFVILGISDLCNEFLFKRVFETNDGKTRLYVMPFDYSNEAEKKTMWQLSFKINTIEEGLEISKTSQSLITEALKKCEYFHNPVLKMINQTKKNYISGHSVFDRKLATNVELKNSRVIFVGDSLHPMSPFKGQGANQALLDATLFGKTLMIEERTTNLVKIIEKYHFNCLKRCKRKVEQSRKAVDDLHCKEATIPSSLQVDGNCSLTTDLPTYLKSKGIDCNSTQLDKVIVQEIGYGSRPHLLHQTKITKSRQNLN